MNSFIHSFHPSIHPPNIMCSFSNHLSSLDNTMTKIYIGNISYETTAESITEHFSQYGEVSSVYVPMDRYSGQPRGFAFLAMPNEVAEAAIAASDGMEMDGRNVEVKVSLPRGAKAPSKTSEFD